MAKRMFSGMVTALVGLLTLTLFMKASLSRACAAGKSCGDWSVEVATGAVSFGNAKVSLSRRVTLAVSSATLFQMRDEKYEELSLFNAQAAPWSKGARLRPLVFALQIYLSTSKCRTCKYRPKYFSVL